MTDWKALAEAHRASRAALGPADVRNVRPSLKEFARYVTTHREELAVIAQAPEARSSASFAKAAADAGAYGVAIAAHEAWGGSPAALGAVAAASPVPVLARSVVLDEQDLYRLRDAGADAAVVRVELVSDAAKLSALRKAARSMMMELLVEVEDEAALRVALASEAAILGVAGGDVALLEKIPSNRVPVRVGGVRSADELAPLLDRIDAVVVVEPFAAGADVTATVASFVALKE